MVNTMQKLILSFFVFLGCGLSGSVHAEPPQGYPFIAYDEGMAQARMQNKKVFLYFGRFGCGYCTKTNIETFSDNALHKLYARNYVLVYVDAESGKRLNLPNGERITEMELGARLNVFATPVFLYLDTDGKVILRAPGFKTVKDFMDMDRYVQGGYYKTQSINEFLQQQARPQ